MRWIVLVAVMTLVAVLCLRVFAQPDSGELAETPGPRVNKGISLSSAAFVDREEVLERELGAAAASGARWVRTEFDWSVTEPSAGQYNWTYSDRLVTLASAHRLQVLGVVGNTPHWARPEGTTRHGAPLRPREFASFAAVVAARYKTRGVRHWEIWNEPNISRFWEPAPDAELYAEVLRLSTAAIHEVDPEAFVLSGGLSPVEDPGSPAGVPHIAFLQAVYESGAMAAVDGVAFHPYTFPEKPDDPESVFAQLPVLHSTLANLPGGGRPIWLTEFGAPTGSGLGSVTEVDQAAIVDQACRQALSWSWIGPLFLYQVRDGGVDANDPEQNFGLLRQDYSSKRAWQVWQDC